jgi:biopolymer transport protein ExbB
VDSDKFIGAIRNFLKESKLSDAIEFCETLKGPLPAVIKTGLLNYNLPKFDIEEMMITKKMEELVKCERFLGVLGTLGNISPLIGLLGTVIGIIRAFRELAISGTGGPAVIAAGIAEALYTTAAGLCVAVPAVICYNYFLKKIKTISVDIDVCIRRLLFFMEQNNLIETSKEREQVDAEI